MTFWMRTQTLSFNMSVSDTRITSALPEDSFSCGELALEDADAGGPPGKAVLNRPVRWTANGYSVFAALKFRRIRSLAAVAIMLSTNCEFRLHFTSTVSLRPSAGLPVNAPAKGKTR